MVKYRRRRRVWHILRSMDGEGGVKDGLPSWWGIRVRCMYTQEIS
jgi:hypothetical protein